MAVGEMRGATPHRFQSPGRCALHPCLGVAPFEPGWALTFIIMSPK